MKNARGALPVFAAALCATPAALSQTAPAPAPVTTTAPNVAPATTTATATVPLSVTTNGAVPYRVRVTDLETAAIAFECTTPCTREVRPGRLQLSGGGANQQPFRTALDVRAETLVTLRNRPLNDFFHYREMLGVGMAGTIVGVLVNLFVGGWYFVGGCPYFALGTQPSCDVMATVLVASVFETGAGLATALAAGAFRPGNAVERVESPLGPAAPRVRWSVVAAPAAGGAVVGFGLRF